MIHKKVTITLAIISLYSSAFAANYVSNDLFTYTHSGPGSKYKILGVVNAGEKISVLDRSSGFTQIRDTKGRKVWINSKYVTNQVGLKEQLEKLKIQYSKLDEKLNSFEDKANKNKLNLEKDLNSNINQVEKLKETNTLLNKQLKEVQEKNDSLNDLLDNEKNELLMKWFSYGGIVAGLGLFVGLVLPSLIPSRKKRSRF